jgi:hypothetical protein
MGNWLLHTRLLANSVRGNGENYSFVDNIYYKSPRSLAASVVDVVIAID